MRRLFARRRSRNVAALALALLVGLAALYAGLAVYKAFDYTSTPAQPPPAETPASVGLAYDEVAFPSADDAGVTLRGWWVPNPASTRVVILVHGRYENRASHLYLVKPLHDAGFNVLLFDLRGHGASTPAPCAYGLRERWDVVAAAEYARGRGFAPQSIGVIGWSLGAASAIMALPLTDDIAAVISDSAYANGEPLLARNALRPGLKLALRLVRGVDIDAVRPERAIVQSGGRHVFLIHGAADRAVPLAQERRLAQAGGPDIVTEWIVPGAGHIGAWQAAPDEYARRVAAFFDGELA